MDKISWADFLSGGGIGLIIPHGEAGTVVDAHCSNLITFKLLVFIWSVLKAFGSFIYEFIMFSNGNIVVFWAF